MWCVVGLCSGLSVSTVVGVVPDTSTDSGVTLWIVFAEAASRFRLSFTVFTTTEQKRAGRDLNTRPTD